MVESFLSFSTRKLKTYSDPFTLNYTYEFLDSDNDTWWIFSIEDNSLDPSGYVHFPFEQWQKLTKERFSQPFRKPSEYRCNAFNVVIF